MVLSNADIAYVEDIHAHIIMHIDIRRERAEKGIQQPQYIEYFDEHLLPHINKLLIPAFVHIESVLNNERKTVWRVVPT